MRQVSGTGNEEFLWEEICWALFQDILPWEGKHNGYIPVPANLYPLIIYPSMCSFLDAMLGLARINNGKDPGFLST